MRRSLRAAGTLAFTVLAIAYLVWKIDIGTTIDVLRDTNVAWLVFACSIMVATVFPMAYRWQVLLAAQHIHDHLRWLSRAYFVSYSAGQILPTSLGGDAIRVLETSRRHPGRTGPITAIVLLERGLGGAATVVLGAIGFLLAVGRYDVGAYLWLEGAFVVGTIVLGFVFFARSARPVLVHGRPLAARLKVEKPLRALYDGVHTYRSRPRLLGGVFVFTIAIQAVRVLAIWATAKAAGVDQSPRLFYVMGPLFFLVLLVPFTLNGFAVREAFFVSFLGNVGVDPDTAFAAGFLFFLVTIVLAVPGLCILAWESVRKTRPAPSPRPGESAHPGEP